MFRRLVFENSAAIFTIVAFITAVSIYVMFAWRALRMKRPQIERFADLPFATPTPASVALRASAGTDGTVDPQTSHHSRSGLQASSAL